MHQDIVMSLTDNRSIKLVVGDSGGKGNFVANSSFKNSDLLTLSAALLRRG